MKAQALLHRRVVLAEDAFVELVVWRVPRPVPPSTHDLRYRLTYVVSGACVLRFDNERGKGDHRHEGTVDAEYVLSRRNS